MKPNTIVTVGYRNVGDAKDSGTFVTAPLKDCLLQLIQWTGATTMATRLQIAIGRNESDCKRGLELVARTKAVPMMDELKEALMMMGADESDLDDSSTAAPSANSEWTPEWKKA